MDKNIKNIIKYGLLVIIPLIIGILSLVIYDLYIDLLKKIDEKTFIYRLVAGRFLPCDHGAGKQHALSV